ncbi:MAG: four helix bundle protein [Candidatus Absconditabacterales bacterium]
MATYDNLPVYKTSYDLLQLISGYINLFSKTYKYALGSRIFEGIIDMISSIFKANCSHSKMLDIQKAREHIEVVRLLIRLANDLHQFSLPQFVQINQLIESISKQLTAWERAMKSFTP